MEKNIDMKLYKEYLDGNKEAFDVLYNKYKKKIQYFIFNIIKEEQKSEDIAQEVFLNIIQHEVKEEYSFKYHIFMLAKSKALNYINIQKRRNEIDEKYIFEQNEKISCDTLEIITLEENKKELLEAINMLDERYKNAMYLAKIEELSYREISEILEESVQNIKNLIHRGKKEIRKILIKKGFNEMNKVSKVLILIICISCALSGITYGAVQIYKNLKGQATLTPVYTQQLSNTDYNSIWVGTFNLVWNELMEQIILTKMQ